MDKQPSKADALRAMREAKFSSAKSSDGGGESRPAARGSDAVQPLQRPGAGASSSRTAGVAPGPSEAKRGLRISSRPKSRTDAPIGDGVALTNMEHPAGLIDAMADAIRSGKLKLGRPLARDRDKTLAALKPWEAEGMSRRTWYRRQKEQKK